jgi:transcription antitermination protein NusB
MKTHKDPRHLERIKVMQELFAAGFKKDQQAELEKTQQILSNLADIDKWIGEAAPMWPIEKINRIDLAILRLAVYELMEEKKTPPKVTVDESVELAKEYGSESSPGFINGALGKLISKHGLL